MVLVSMPANTTVLAINDNNPFNDSDVYSIYDENFQLLFQKDYVSVGDSYLSGDLKYYEVVFIDEDSRNGFAKFVKSVELPSVDKSLMPSPIKIERRVIGMYMTHNDESYVPSDGVSSIYGNGGIKDVALKFKYELEKYMIDVYFDDTLHIPHDSNAYSRSNKTAKSLMAKYDPDALFDIHRDGASRSFYVTNVNGEERARVRLVVGKANPNMDLNEDFALYIFAVGKKLYPWLFTDIFYASGHYNQALSGKAILFEMGSHLVEKELVKDSMTELAEVVTTALYNTTVNTETGDLTINGVETENDKTINDIMEEREEQDMGVMVAIIISIVLIASVCIYATWFFYKTYRKSLISKKSEK